MNQIDIAYQRLRNQRLSGSQFETPAEWVGWMGAVQAQDFAGAKWALGLRVPASTDSRIEQAFSEGRILRTHVMRPTWHFVTPADIRWMLKLTAPRVNALAAYYYRKLELDESVFLHAKHAIIKALEGGSQLTRDELNTALARAGIVNNDLRMIHIMMWAELDGLICSGARRGKQFTYALLDERAPQTKLVQRDEALAELVRRYFTSHGPATVQDFVWWSGLTTADARAGIDAVKSQLEYEIVDDQTYWFASAASIGISQSAAVYLLPNFDEYTVGYSDRSAVYEGEPPNGLDPRGVILLNYVIVMDSQVIGTWRRTFKKGRVLIELKPFAPLSDRQSSAVLDAAQRYADFLKLVLEIV